MKSRAKLAGAFLVASAIAVAACGSSSSSSTTDAPETSAAAVAPAVIKVFGAFASPKEEPWDGVIDAALQAEADAGVIEYTSMDKIGYDGDMERVLRETCQKDAPAIIFGDAFGNEEAVRAAAADCPETAFVFGSGNGPTEPNVSVFDNWIHEPAYLLGMLAGGLTKSNKIGIVGAMPIPEVNRLANAFIAGAQLVNPKVEVKVTFINSFFDPATAKEAALAQIADGVDVLYAERAGVIEAAAEKGVLALGNMSDQSSIAPDTVVSSAVWNMTATVKYVISQVSKGAYSAQDLKDFSMMGKGGASIAPINEKLVKADLLKKVQDQLALISNGGFRVDINEGQPAGSVNLG